MTDATVKQEAEDAVEDYNFNMRNEGQVWRRAARIFERNFSIVAGGITADVINESEWSDRAHAEQLAEMERRLGSRATFKLIFARAFADAMGLSADRIRFAMGGWGDSGRIAPDPVGDLASALIPHARRRYIRSRG